MEVHYILRTAQNTNANLLKLCFTCWMTFMMVAPANHSLAWIRESNQKPVLFSAVASVLIYNGMMTTHWTHGSHS